MSNSYRANDHRDYAAAGLKDYADYSEGVEYGPASVQRELATPPGPFTHAL